jgi:AcrR family transcriptional regulator
VCTLGNIVEPVKRPYNAPRREAAAAQTRATILRAAQARFERDGWAATTIKAVAEDAGVSPKTIEASFGTKAALLDATVTFVFRGEEEDVPMGERGPAQAFAAATTAAEALNLHAAYGRPIAQRTARIAAVVESAPPVQELWGQMLANARFGMHWAAEHILGLPGLRADATAEFVETTLRVAMDWATYRLLTTERGYTPEAYEAWMREYYARMLLEPGHDPGAANI